MLDTDISYRNFDSRRPGKFHLLLRKSVLTFLKLTATDITIIHHFNGSPFRLNSYMHKGYWFYGRKREKNTIKRFREIIKEEMNILEVGGHIGYLSVFFSMLTGKKGSVTVFEPGRNNLTYLFRNISAWKFRNIIVEELAAGDKNCEMSFYLDPLTGQNNTLVRNFEGFTRNRSLSAQPDAEYTTDTVEVIRLDDYYAGKKLPDFVKIDIEGYEWECIEGFKRSLEKQRPVMMIEVQANEEKIWNYFAEINYRVFNDEMREINNLLEFSSFRSPNMFFIPA